MADYKIELGINFNDSELKNIKKQLTSLTDNTHRIRIDIDNSRLLKQINHAKKELKELNGTKGNQPSLIFNTQSLEKSLGRVADVIEEVRKSLGTLDDKSGMKSLVASVNQIATALGKAEDESDNLVKSLSVLSKKDFSINFSLKMGKSASQISSEQGDIKRDAISQLKQQAKALEDYLDQYYKVAQRQEGVVKLTQGTNLFSSFWEMSPNIGDTKASLKQQVSTYKQYIDLMQEAAKIKGVDLSSVTSGFSKTTNDIVEETKKVSDGAEEVKQALKGIFGGSLDVEGLSGQLQPIITDLNEIKTAIQTLSSNNSIDGLTQSFNRLSETLEKLTANLTLVKSTLDTGFSNSSPANNAIKTAQQTGQNIGKTISRSVKQSINLDDVIDEQVLKLMNEYAISGGKGSKAFDEIRQSLVDFRNGSGDINRITSAISNNMKVVNEAKNDYKELADYIRMFNASGAKVHIPDSIRQEYGDDYKSMRSQLGKGFTSGQGMDFETFIVETNSILGDTIDLSHGAEAAFGDLVRKVNSTKGGKFLTGDDLFRSGILDMGDVVANVSASLEQIESAEEEIARTSTATANTVIQNEERKQQAIEQVTVVASSTSDAIKQMQDTMSGMKFDRSSIDAVAKDLENLGIEISKISLKDNGANLYVTVKGIDDVGRAVTEIRMLDKATDEISPISKTFTQSFETSVEAAKRLEKETTASFKRLKSLAKEMGEVDFKIAGLDTNKDADEIRGLQRYLDGLKSEYKELYSVTEQNLSVSQFKELEQIFASTTGEIREFKSELAKSAQTKELAAGLERLKYITKEINSLKIDIFKFEDADNIERATIQLNELENEAAELRATLQQKFNITSFDEVDDIARKGEEALNSLITKAEEAKAKLAKGIKADIDLGNFDDEMDAMRTKFNSLSDANDDLRRSFKATEDAYKAMLNVANANTGDEVADRERLIQAEKEYAAALEKTNNLIKQQARADKIDADALRLQDDREVFQAKIDSWLTKNSAATERFGAKLKELRAAAETADRVELNHLEKELVKVDKAADKAGLKMMSLGDRIKSKAKEYMAYISVAEVFMWIEQAARAMFDTVLEIDTAMTGLHRVTDLTASQYDALFNNMISSAKEYGATLNDIINATTDWVRAGFDADTALGLAEVTTMYQHISDLDYDTAAENLITAYNGFKDELNTAFSGDQVAAVEYIADIFNELDRQNCP